MPSVEEEQERAVFDEVDEDDDVSDDTDDDDDDDDEEDLEDAAAAAPPPPPVAAAAAATVAAGDTNSSPSTSTSSDRALNPNPNPNNGSAQLQPLPTAPPVAVNVGGGGDMMLVVAAGEQRKPPPPVAGYDETRRLFQRLWTDEDELVILQGFLDFISQRGTMHASHQHDTGPFYEQVRAQLQLDFTKNQLIEKLRRLKKKFRTVASRMGSHGKDFAFKSPHEQATFEISRKIWSSHLKRSRDGGDDDDLLNIPIKSDEGAMDPSAGDRGTSASRSRRRRRRYASVDAAGAVGVPVMEISPSPAVMGNHHHHQKTPLPPPVMPAAETAPVTSVIEETVRSCLSPLFKELLNSAIGGAGMGGGALGLSLMPLSFPGGIAGNLPPTGSGGAAAAAVDEKWRNQQILELEVFLKRTELVQDQVKKTLEELRAMGSS